MSCALLQHEGRNVAYVASVALGEDVLRAGTTTELVLTNVAGQCGWVPAVEVRRDGEVTSVLVIGPGLLVGFDDAACGEVFR